MGGFVRYPDFDPTTALRELDDHPELWGERPFRGLGDSPHREADDIWIRFQSKDDLESQTCIWYPPAYVLRRTYALTMWAMTGFCGEQLGRVVLARLPPGGRIYPHADLPDHAAYYHRIHFLLQGEMLFTVDGKSELMTQGQVWEIDNSKVHEVVNTGYTDRISLIVDIRSTYQ